ncbi:UDP-N-acetylglucosamine 1-carboxyvinyltransferase [Fodinisporobacter ferrooxydans]|uniref:UDP-N-acetylglucosamine 1-carboxyvinyltransferase n=1 Tax=Fodinisporobacter ferrooxydans TaxID=2901836 RepID=A0ABY4CF65_9BACL|nr:UDP-N-acetylglucosamine 1-carboxyvinyltransferase [Alicyclobacillaceae bacterium MYW30-H2]
MDTLAIEGGKLLQGTVRVHGAKNAALPIMAATLLADGECILEDVPDLKDIDVMMEILSSLGAVTTRSDAIVTVDATTIHQHLVQDEMMRKMRSSIFLMGPLLSKFGQVRISKPGGCTIGTRPIDFHLKGMKALGAEIIEANGYVECRAKRLQGNHIYLDYPSVGATENLMMAAALAEGTTIIGNAAREPEIVDLANFLRSMGASISGAGEDTIVIEGVDTLQPVNYRIIPDRIVAGTLVLAVAATGGDVELQNVRPQHLGVVLTKLREAGVEIRTYMDRILIRRRRPLTAIDRIQTAPYPGFPTDLQAPFMAVLTLAKGTSVISETVFEERFKHVSELQRMGANIKVDLRTAFVQGVSKLTGASVAATDLRAGAALVIAGLAAEGTTIVEQVHHIDRGYQQIEQVLQSLGASIQRTYRKW